MMSSNGIMSRELRSGRFPGARDGCISGRGTRYARPFTGGKELGRLTGDGATTREKNSIVLAAHRSWNLVIRR